MKRITAILLCLCLVFAGCAKDDAYTPTGDGLTYEDGQGGAVQKEDEEQELTLTYYPQESMNPILSTDLTNRVIFSLLYQSLFVVDRDYSVEPMLCKKYSISEDMQTYTFYLEDATFSDGAPVTVQDVLASFQAAKESTYYGGRFLHISQMSVTPDGGFAVTLDTPYENFPILLDIPIVPKDQVSSPQPLGSGPYIFSAGGKQASLLRRSNWWCSAPQMTVTAPQIALLEAQSPAQIRDNFQFAGLDVVCADPGSSKYADYRCDHELWSMETGLFLYLACCDLSPVFSNPEVRAALTYAIDRDLLVDEYYRGFGSSATLPASPQFPYYSQTLAEKYGYDAARFSQALTDAGLQGSQIVLLVNADDTLRVRTAREIGKMLTDCGLVVEVRELSTRNYNYAIQNRNYDLYLGQTRLSPNMDLSAFFHTWGDLSYGGVDDPAAYALCQDALANYGNYYTLHQTVMDRGLLCPVLFRTYAVYATRGAVTTLTPSRDNVFYYSLGKTMESALIRE